MILDRAQPDYCLVAGCGSCLEPAFGQIKTDCGGSLKRAFLAEGGPTKMIKRIVKSMTQMLLELHVTRLSLD